MAGRENFIFKVFHEFQWRKTAEYDKARERAQIVE